MISVQKLMDQGYDFFVGVPDSSLKGFIQDIIDSGVEHVIATHESQAIGIAVGAELAGKKTCVYMQNSGLGNAINPLASLCMPYGIEPLLIIGHRTAPFQHEVMGRCDVDLLVVLGYGNYEVSYD